MNARRVVSFPCSGLCGYAGRMLTTESQFKPFLTQLQSSLSLTNEPFRLQYHPQSAHLEVSFSPDFLEAKEAPFSIDFTANRYTSRILQAKHELLVKAIGLQTKTASHRQGPQSSALPGPGPVVWDLTAGLGRDAFVMAAAGCRVHMCENNPVIFALLHDALSRLRKSDDSTCAAIAGRLRLHHLDSAAALGQDTSASLLQHAAPDLLQRRNLPSVLYLDPMYSSLESVHRKSKPKKETQILQRLTHLDYKSSSDNMDTDINNDRLLQLALDKGNCRVVVKRAKSARPLLSTSAAASSSAASSSLCRPDSIFRGSTQRFDVYFS
jgi:hypothetical protein